MRDGVAEREREGERPRFRSWRLRGGGEREGELRGNGLAIRSAGREEGAARDGERVRVRPRRVPSRDMSLLRRCWVWLWVCVRDGWLGGERAGWWSLWSVLGRR